MTTLYGVDAQVNEYMGRAKNIVITGGRFEDISSEFDNHMKIEILNMIIEVAKMIQIEEGR